MNPFTYQPRQVTYHGVTTVGAHRFKTYAMRSERFAEAPMPSAEQIGRLFAQAIPSPSLEADHPVGFGILHWANDGLYVLGTTWFDANMMRLKVFKVDDLHSAVPQITPLDHLNIITCVWEIVVYMYERDLWVKEVLSKSPTQLDETVLAGYLSQGYEGAV
jgi:hypothetical protein